MIKYKIILFDLDGTLSDPKEGITKSVEYALEKMNVVSHVKNLECFIGPPLQESFATYCGLDKEETHRAIELYRERFKKVGMFENILYQGIEHLLQSLKSQQYILAVATSKPTPFAEQILKYFHIDHLFDLIVGSNLDGTRTSKTEIIQYILDEYKNYDKSEFVMIGDRKHDIIGALNTGIDSIGVTYGYGSHKEIKDANPTYIVNHVNELKDILFE